MEQTIVCCFCKGQVKPRRVAKGETVTYWCTKCNSIIAAYSKEFDTELRFGSLFRKYLFDSHESSQNELERKRSEKKHERSSY